MVVVGTNCKVCLYFNFLSPRDIKRTCFAYQLDKYFIIFLMPRNDRGGEKKHIITFNDC